MRTLTVRKFSCITEAALDIFPITLIIGPQASGKSVLCKLAYFFASLISDQVRAIIEMVPFEEFTKRVKIKFARWFALETWGSQKFELAFDFGGCRIEIIRTISKGKGGKGINLHFSRLLIDHYERSLQRINEQEKKKRRDADAPEFSYEMFTLENSVREELNKVLGEGFVNLQLFVPAARSFFTSLGRAIPAFENSNMLDPLTVIFGRLYAGANHSLQMETPNDRAIRSLLKDATRTMLGGTLVREGEREVIQTGDGRTIPLGTLSSGQQEILPLLRVLPQSASRGRQRIIYVEEPEAHLFPDAQSKLVELLAALSNLYGVGTSMVITTHSPYVLTKFNNLITAGKVGKMRNRAAVVAAVVPSQSWVPEGKLGAYALESGKLSNIVDGEGLINADYLDAVSNQIGSEYTRLLDLEFGISQSRNER